jgi:hypothetical protein
MDWTTGNVLWYSTGAAPLVIRWLLVRDPAGVRPIRAFFSTDCHQSTPMISDVVDRWTLEITLA